MISNSTKIFLTAKKIKIKNTLSEQVCDRLFVYTEK